MLLQRMTNNSLDGSINRIGAPQRTGSLKSSGKEKPPPYRSALARNVTESVRNASNPTDQVPPTGINDNNSNQQHDNESENTNEKMNTSYNIRGIPTAEITGSTVDTKLPRSESKSESTKKTSKLARMSQKKTQEPKVDKINLAENSSSSMLETVGSQPRRNSLERPSYYNSLYKAGLRPYNGIMSQSLNLPTEHSLNGEISSDSINKEQYNKLDKYLSSRTDNGESSASEYDYHSVRPYSTLGRTLSLKGPSSKLYDPVKVPEKSNIEIEAKYSRSPTASVSRVSGLKGGDRYSSRFLRPKSFYGATDLTNYQGLQPGSTTEVIPATNSDLIPERKSAFVSRRSPSYQRSISLFEGKKAVDNYRQSSSVTPDRSVLGKFLMDKKLQNEPEKVLKDEINDKPKVRKVSRFLRPDFYDTPKEDSVYEKKEKIKNVPNGEIWKEKEKKTPSRQKKSSKKDDKNQENRLSMVDKAIKSLKENTLSNIDSELMARESNLIKRAVSLEDCSLVPENRSRRSTSLTPQTDFDNKISTKKFDKMFQKKKVEDFKKIVDQKLNTKNKEFAAESNIVGKSDSVIKKIVRKISPKIVKQKLLNHYEDPISCNGFVENNVEDSGTFAQDSRSSRLSRIAGLKRLEFSRPLPSADSTPSVEESKASGEFDDSSSFLSPTEDGSDTWSISSDYADAREFITPSMNEDSVSERIRRKSFYSRFNQSKRRKSQSSQLGGSRSRLPMYSKSMSSDFTNGNLAKPTRKVSDPEYPADN